MLRCKHKDSAGGCHKISGITTGLDKETDLKFGELLFRGYTNIEVRDRLSDCVRCISYTHPFTIFLLSKVEPILKDDTYGKCSLSWVRTIKLDFSLYNFLSSVLKVLRCLTPKPTKYRSLCYVQCSHPTRPPPGGRYDSVLSLNGTTVTRTP